MNAKKALGQDATGDVAAKLALDVGGIAMAGLASGSRLGKQRLGVLTHDLVQHRLVRPPSRVRGRTGLGLDMGTGAGRCQRHG